MLKKYRETILILILLICVLTTLGFYLALQPELPSAPRRIAHVAGGDRPTTATIQSDDGETTPREATRYRFLGEKPIFMPLIEKPTPPPTPTPTPKPMPRIDAVLKDWKLAGLNPDSIEIQSGEQFFQIRLGDMREVQLGNVTLKVLLSGIDVNNYSAKFRAPADEKNEQEPIDQWSQELVLKF